MNVLKSKLLHRTKNYDHVLFPLQALLRRIEIQMLIRKYIPCFSAVKYSRQKFIIIGLFLNIIFEISSLKTSSVTVQPGLCRSWSETSKTGFVMTQLK